MMRRAIFLAGLLAAGTAQADWAPKVISNQYWATVNYGGGTLAYGEDAKAAGPLQQTVSQLLSVPYTLQQGMNERVSQLVSQNGASFLGGTVSGNPSITIRPDASGVAYISLSGLSYQVRSQYSGHKWGVISYSCTNTLTLSNIVINAQYGSANGAMQDGKTGMTASTSSSTDCDSNLSWILPVVGDVLISKAEGKIDSSIQSHLQAGLALVKDALLYKPGQNMLNGLSGVIPPGKVVSLPGGGVFPLGQYIQNNASYLLGNSQLSIQLGSPIALRTVPGTSEPMTNDFSSDAATISLSAPGMAFTVKLSQRMSVDWLWRCPVGNPGCRIP